MELQATTWTILDGEGPVSVTVEHERERNGGLADSYLVAEVADAKVTRRRFTTLEEASTQAGKLAKMLHQRRQAQQSVDDAEQALWEWEMAASEDQTPTS